MFDLSQGWALLATRVADSAVAPVLHALHLTQLAGDPVDIAQAVMIALLQLGIIALVFRPLESLAPAEKWADRRLTRVDLQYTLMMLLGIFPLFSFLVLTPIANFFGGSPTADGVQETAIGLTHWFPTLEQHPLALFLIYYAIYDLVYYWMHRLQHVLPWWWALHSMHHSQRQMSCWTNDRGSPIDGLVQSLVLAAVGLVIGVSPSDFAWLMLLGELVQNFSHANVRLGFGRVLGRVFVDPPFHRLHHMVVDPHRPTLHNCNFGQVLSIWDVVFGTALHGEPVRPTGVSDPVVDADNERNLLGLHWAAAQRFWGAVRRPAGWKLGEVGFGPGFAPIPVDQLPAHTASLSPPRQGGPDGGDTPAAASVTAAAPHKARI